MSYIGTMTKKHKVDDSMKTSVTLENIIGWHHNMCCHLLKKNCKSIEPTGPDITFNNISKQCFWIGV